ncbi:MAG: hypothetical protein RLZZ618_3944 [Pseudomonadota bacterium]
MNTLADLRAGRLIGARRLALREDLTEFPPEVFDLADSLEVLDLSSNRLSSLPHDLPRLHRLRVIFGSFNRFTELPAVLGRCEQLETVGFRGNQISHVPPQALGPALRALILTDNTLEWLPEVLGRCVTLEKLMLAGNRLGQLPGDLAGCERLELLRISANRFEQLPAGLLQLRRLAWLACGGNPFSEPRHASGLPWVEHAELSCHEVIGSGASGVIHRATWQSPAGPRVVAVKLFKAGLSSDGLPRSEMAACAAAGDHPHLVGTLARVAGSGGETAGLVMRLVPPAFHVLALPPSLDSCVRDRYAPGTRLPAAEVWRVALAVAQACAHLHASGLLHGDLYGHNVMVDGAHGTLLGDLGAAAFMPDGPAAAGLQRIEVRAFGCLLEELLQQAESLAGLTGMAALQARCVSPDIDARPLFDEVVLVLSQLAPQGPG